MIEVCCIQTEGPSKVIYSYVYVSSQLMIVSH